MAPDAADAASAGAAFAAWLHRQARPPRVAVVHAFSMHNLLLRHWLAAADVDPDRDLEIVVIPPERVVAALAEGTIAGFCAGAPWGDQAEALGSGRVLLGSSAIRAGHAEKCLAVSAAFAAESPEALAALTHCIALAQRVCGRAETADALATLLADRLDLPAAATRAALPGGAGVEHVGFTDAAAIAPAEAHWSLRAMQRWGWLVADAEINGIVADVLA